MKREQLVFLDDHRELFQCYYNSCTCEQLPAHWLFCKKESGLKSPAQHFGVSRPFWVWPECLSEERDARRVGSSHGWRGLAQRVVMTGELSEQ